MLSRPASQASARFYETFSRWCSIGLHHRQRLRVERKPAGQRDLTCLTRRSEHQVSTGTGSTRAAIAHRAPTRCRYSASSDTRAATSDSQFPERARARLGTNTSNIDIHPDLSSHLRLLMRRVPHSVVVVTASIPSSMSPSADRISGETSTRSLPTETMFRGMTISSFNTVTLDPVPLISLNVKTPSATYDAMAASKFFLVHLLSSGPAGARIGDAFARGGNTHGEVFGSLTQYGQNPEIQVFSGKGTHGAPLLAGAGVMQVLRCKLLEGKDVIVGDHRVLVAEVVGIVNVPSSLGKSQDDARVVTQTGEGLIYSDGRFRSWGPAIDMESELPQPTRATTASENGEPVVRTMGMNVRRGNEAM